MKKLLIIGILSLTACNYFKTDQEKAEIAVMKYEHISENSDAAKKMKFTPLQNHTIGLIDGADMPTGIKNVKFKKTAWYQLDNSYETVTALSID